MDKAAALAEKQFLSTPSARRATDNINRVYDELLISIHALREEGDPVQCHFYTSLLDFYPRPPRGGRHNHRQGIAEYRKFLSTPSARRATRESTAT